MVAYIYISEENKIPIATLKKTNTINGNIESV